MALQKRIELDTGIVLEEAYIRITEGILSLDRGVMYITVETYASREARVNKKVPVFKKEFLCDSNGSKPRVDANYTLKFNSVEPSSNLGMTITIDGESFELIEGTHIVTDGTSETLSNSVCERLNDNDLFNESYVATVEENGDINIKSKIEGQKGNGLSINGTMVREFKQDKIGADRTFSNFEKYFVFDLMNQEGKNLILLAYEFIKDLPEYEGAIDVI
jgi:hypothetical protein